MAETKSSSIKTPFNDAVFKKNVTGTGGGGSDKASPPKSQGEMYHNEKAKT